MNNTAIPRTTTVTATSTDFSTAGAVVTIENGVFRAFITLQPVGPRAAWRDRQRVEIIHDPGCAGVRALVGGKPRLFCLVTGEEISEPTKAARWWAIPAATLPDLRRVLDMIPKR